MLAFFYPTSPGREQHSKLSSYAMDSNEIDDLKKILGIFNKKEVENLRTKFKAGLKDELDQISHQNIIFSSEHCSSRLIIEDDVTRLYHLLSNFGHNIKVIIYLRRQDHFLISEYSTAIKYGKTHDLDIPNQKIIRTRYSYDKILELWANVFGRENISVRIFEKESFYKK